MGTRILSQLKEALARRKPVTEPLRLSLATSDVEAYHTEVYQSLVYGSTIITGDDIDRIHGAIVGPRLTATPPYPYPYGFSGPVEVTSQWAEQVDD